MELRRADQHRTFNQRVRRPVSNLHETELAALARLAESFTRLIFADEALRSAMRGGWPGRHWQTESQAPRNGPLPSALNRHANHP